MTAALDVAIGLGFVYLSFSLTASCIVEWSSAIFDRRTNFLRLALAESLGAELARELVMHPVICGIAPGRRQSWRYRLPQPSYLPPQAVALALADIARQQANNSTQTPLVKLMLALKSELTVASANQVLAVDAEVLFRIERWFKEQMGRTTAGYKRWTQLWTIVLALLLTIAFDIDAGRIARHLIVNADLRSALAGTASSEVAKERLAQVESVPLGTLPVGWTRTRAQALGDGPIILATTAGWAMSVIAIGLGAPFWFDLLNRLVSLRQTGPKPADAFSAE